VKKNNKPFIVADLETVLIDDVHVPYAAGFLVVNPGDKIVSKPDDEFDIQFSEDHIGFLPDFKDRSRRMMNAFHEGLLHTIHSNKEVRTVLFHNLSRFDGIILLKYYVLLGEPYSVQTLMRNNKIYEIKILQNKELLFRFRDSLLLLPGTLAGLGKTLCPELGSKGILDHEEIEVSNLSNRRVQLLDYMKQDIRLLGGVMLKAQ
jgi:hypothetical protein